MFWKNFNYIILWCIIGRMLNNFQLFWRTVKFLKKYCYYILWHVKKEKSKSNIDLSVRRKLYWNRRNKSQIYLPQIHSTLIFSCDSNLPNCKFIMLCFFPYIYRENASAITRNLKIYKNVISLFKRQRQATFVQVRHIFLK